MKALLLLTILIQATLLSSNAQSIGKKLIDERVKLIDTLTHKKQTRLYIINGVPFNDQDSIKIDSALKSYHPSGASVPPKWIT